MTLIEAIVNLTICVVHAISWRKNESGTENWQKTEIATLAILHLVLFLAFSASAAHAL